GGGSYTQTTPANIPAGLAAGTYYLGAIADSANQQTESNENNNTRVATSSLQVIQDVDLLISSVSTPDSQVYTGTRISVLNTTQNTGGSSTDSAFLVGIYLSTDATITTSDIRIGWHRIYNLSGGGSYTQTTPANIPAGLAAGTYYLGAIADSANQQTESNENNNGLTAAIPLNVD
ncbi:MAG: peptidase, partial [Gammaproteobacteria bacterium]|nr:peptidase [Gammaproteobacteria bacterium]